METTNVIDTTVFTAAVCRVAFIGIVAGASIFVELKAGIAAAFESARDVAAALGAGIGAQSTFVNIPTCESVRV